MIRTGVIGYPVQHSLSPLIHNYWIDKYGFDGHYGTHEIAPSDLSDTLKKLSTEYAGFNVTIPHKQRVIELCDTLDDTAQKIGAVNTLVIDSGKIHGTNTDSFGFAENIRQAEFRVDINGTALVLGAGGAARGVIHALQTLGFQKIKIANRTLEKTQAIAKDFGVEAIEWKKREQAGADISLLVNTTSLGMTGQLPLEYDLHNLPPGAAVCDIVYKPLYTVLLHEAQKRGLGVITGIGMLLHQARPAFAAWYGTMPDIDENLQRKIDEALA